MTPRQLFEQLKPLIHSEAKAVYPGVVCCILATRIAIEVANYFGISVSPLAVRMVVYNRACAEDPKGAARTRYDVVLAQGQAAGMVT